MICCVLGDSAKPKRLHSIMYVSLDLFTETFRVLLKPSLMFQLPRAMFQVTVIAYIFLLVGALHCELVTVACIIAALSIWVKRWGGMVR